MALKGNTFVWVWWNFVGSLVGALICLQSFCYSHQAADFTFLQDASSAPTTSYYDYIIVGGGTAGCPLAATLSQNFRVLLIERGGSPYGNPNITDLASFGAAFADRSPQSPSQLFTSEDGVPNVRPRVLGGGTCLNAGFYTRASVEYIKKAGWDGKLVNESYQWIENQIVYEPHIGQWVSAARDGLVEVGVTPNNGFTYDHIPGTKVGGTIFDRNARRHTAADLLQHANPKQLTVLLNATVCNILFTTKGKPIPAAYGVVFSDASGIKRRAFLKKASNKNEIIISAGALGSPQLLMLSGVGPAAHLKSRKIPVVLDQPMVGQGMSDNPMNAIYSPSPKEVESSLVQVVGISPYGTFIESASGSNLIRYFGRKQNFGVFQPQTKNLFAVRPKEETPNVKNYDFNLEESNSTDAVFRGGFIVQKVIGPLSTGYLELKNKDPRDNPSVTFNYFANVDDLKSCVEGVKIILKVIGSKAFSGFTYSNLSLETLVNMTLTLGTNLIPDPVNVSLRSLEQFCKDTVRTIWHYHGGCQVRKVVDHEFRVMGIDSVRVVDGSIFEYSPGTNPQATVMMLGRYLGVKIMNERLNGNA